MNPTINLSRCLISLQEKGKPNKARVFHWEPDQQYSWEFTSHTLYFYAQNFKPQPYIFETKELLCIVLGNPIVDERISSQEAVSVLTRSHFSEKAISSLNGTFNFFVFDRKHNEFIVINDRFTAIPIYYYHSPHEFLVSYNFRDLSQVLKEQQQAKWNLHSFYEVFHLSRMFGEETLLKGVSFLPAASVLKISIAETLKQYSLQPYWVPNYTKSSLSLRMRAELLSDQITTSIRRQTSDHQRYGLFLSGGLDTRVILSHFPFAPECFTAVYEQQYNREYAVAKELAALKGANHHFLQIPLQQFTHILKEAAHQGGGMYQINSIFLGFEEMVSSKVNVAFCGHGFDFMFQGMYLPQTRLKLLGRTLPLKIPLPYEEDLVSQFLRTISYQNKYPGFLRFVKKPYQQELTDFLYTKLGKIVKQAQQLSGSPVDHWEYLNFHSLGRHYSYPDRISINSNAEERSVSFDNDIYQTYLSTPHAHRFDARLQRAVLTHKGQGFEKVLSANDDLPITSSFWKTWYSFEKSLKQRIKKTHQSYLDVQPNTRTWRGWKWVILNEPQIQQRILELPYSEQLSEIQWLDHDFLHKSTIEWLNAPNSMEHQGWDFLLWTLLTFQMFLED